MSSKVLVFFKLVYATSLQRCSDIYTNFKIM